MVQVGLLFSSKIAQVTEESNAYLLGLFQH